MKTPLIRPFAVLFWIFFAVAAQTWAAPVFSVHPVRSQVVDEKAPVTFAVSADGSGELTYQWLRNGLPIAGANGSTLTLASVQYLDRGFYQVTAADSTGVSRSHAGFLNVRIPNEIIGWGNFSVPVPAGLSDVLAISIGYDRALVGGSPGDLCLALKSDGTVAGWNAAPPVPVGLSDVVAIAAGGKHCLALKSDGTVVGWTTFPSFSHAEVIPAGLSGVVAIAAGADTSLALKEDGTVIEWGSRTVGYPADIVAIAAGQNFTLALKSDGTLLSDGSVSPLPPFQGMPTEIAAISGGGFSLALKSNGTVISNGPAVPNGLAGVVAIAAGDSHSVGLISDGTVVAWGDSSQGRTAVPAGLGGVFAIEAGHYTTLALKRTLKPVIVSQPQPPAQTLNEPSSVTYSITVTGGGLRYQWMKDGSAIAGATSASYTIARLSSYDAGSYSVVVSNSLGSVISNAATLLLRGPTFTKDPEVSQVVTDNESVTFSAAAAGTGELAYQWLHDGMPVAGATGSSMTLANTPYSARGYYQLKVTDSLGTAISKAGFLNVVVPGTLGLWGYNEHGVNTPPAGLSGVVAFSAGYSQNLALKSDGTVVAWGADDAASQVPAGLSGVVAISCKGYYVALKSDGTIVAWGKNRYDQNATFSGLSGVVAVSGQFVLKADGSVGSWSFEGDQPYLDAADVMDVTAISASGRHLLALKSDGSVRDLPLYDGVSAVPAGLSGVTAVSVWDSFSVALKSDGTVVTWGTSQYGRSSVPTGLSGIVAVSPGADHVVALKSDGTTVAWGTPESYNNGGQAIVPATQGFVFAVDAGSLYNLVLESPYTTPSVTTKPVTDLHWHSATFNAGIIPNGIPTSVYFQLRTDTLSYETVTSPQLVGSGKLPVNAVALVTNLPAGKTLYYRAVATNSHITSYGADQSFTTLSAPPSVIEAHTGSAVISGVFTPNGLPTSAYFEYQTTSGPLVQSNTQEFGTGTAPVTLTQSLSGLQGGQIYRVRLVSSNATGITYSEYQTFSTAANPRPSVTSISVSGVSAHGVTFNSSVNPNGIAASVHFEYGATSAYGTTTAAQNVSAGYSEVAVNAMVNELPGSHLFHYRAVAANANGSSYGEDQTFTTFAASLAPPVLSKPFFQIQIGGNRVTITGNCNPNDVPTKVHIEVGDPSFRYRQVAADKEIGSGSVPMPVSFIVPKDTLSGYVIVVATSAHGRDVAEVSVKPSAWAENDTVTSGTKPVRIDVRANDGSFAGYTPAISSVTQGRLGTVAINSDLSLQYVPGPNFGGSDTFTYTIPDGLGGSSTATVKILGDSTVTPSAYPGNYVGLALSDPVLPHNCGYLRASVTKTGAFTGRLQYAGGSFAVKGSVAPGRGLTIRIQPPGQPVVMVDFEAGTHGEATIDVIISLEKQVTLVAFEARRSPYTKAAPCDLLGSYTATLPPETPSIDPALPHVAGYAAITINRLGVARVVGKLGDGTPISVEGLVDDTRQLPFYSLIYGKTPAGKGSILGNIKFQMVDDVPQCSGLLYWYKPSHAADKFYPNGFTTTLNLAGGSYTSSAPALMLPTGQPNAVFTISGGNLADTVGKELGVTSSYKVGVMNPAADRLLVRIVPRTGIFSGSFRDPASNSTRPFGGVILQRENIGVGLFFGNTETGAVLFKPKTIQQ